MDGTLKDAAIAVFSFALFSGLLQQRAHHAIIHDASRSIKGGVLRAEVKPRGLLGMLTAQSSLTRIEGQGFSTDSLPFTLQSGSGVRVHVRRLQIDFQDITLHNQSVRSFRADIPNVSLDLARAFFDERIILRSAGEGTGSAVISTDDLRAFIVRKYPQFQNVETRLTPGKVFVRVETVVLGTRALVEAEGTLASPDGVLVNLTAPILRYNGKEPTPAFAQTLLRSINPVLNINSDLGLNGFFLIREIEIGQGQITVRGRATIPRAAPPVLKLPTQKPPETLPSSPQEKPT